MFTHSIFSVLKGTPDRDRSVSFFLERASLEAYVEKLGQSHLYLLDAFSPVQFLDIIMQSYPEMVPAALPLLAQARFSTPRICSVSPEEARDLVVDPDVLGFRTKCQRYIVSLPFGSMASPDTEGLSREDQTTCETGRTLLSQCTVCADSGLENLLPVPYYHTDLGKFAIHLANTDRAGVRVYAHLPTESGFALSSRAHKGRVLLEAEHLSDVNDALLFPQTEVRRRFFASEVVPLQAERLNTVYEMSELRKIHGLARLLSQLNQHLAKDKLASPLRAIFQAFYLDRGLRIRP